MLVRETMLWTLRFVLEPKQRPSFCAIQGSMIPFSLSYARREPEVKNALRPMHEDGDRYGMIRKATCRTATGSAARWFGLFLSVGDAIQYNASADMDALFKLADASMYKGLWSNSSTCRRERLAYPRSSRARLRKGFILSHP